MDADSAGPLLLAIETSCDETAVALMAGQRLLAGEVASQIPLHQAYGGVVPEVASREHLTRLRPLLDSVLQKAGVTMEQVDAFAATSGPGLATSLMIGLSAAKGLAVGFGKPFLAVNHLEGHLLSPFFGEDTGVEPCVALVVSGGHTMLVEVRALGYYRLLGQTRDDAAGEAFDKVGKLLGLPYPGGPQIERIARDGNARRFDFPRSMMHSGDFAFSFSGLKTAVRYLIPKLSASDLPDICASFQEAVVEVLTLKTIAAARAHGHRVVSVSGGVSCNRRLRDSLASACEKAGLDLRLAEGSLCTDNAAMIANVAARRLRVGLVSTLDDDIDPNLRLTATAGG